MSLLAPLCFKHHLVLFIIFFSESQACYAALIHIWHETSLDFFFENPARYPRFIRPNGERHIKVLIHAVMEHKCSRLDKDILALPVPLGGKRAARHDKPMF